MLSRCRSINAGFDHVAPVDEESKVSTNASVAADRRSMSVQMKGAVDSLRARRG